MLTNDRSFISVSDTDLEQAFADLRARWDGTVTRTVVGKIRFHDPRAREALEWAATLVTNMTSVLLELLCEKRTTVHEHRAFGCVLEMLRQKRAKKRKGTKVQILTQVIKETYGDHPKLDSHAIPLAATLRDNVFRNCAVMIWLWYSDVQKKLYSVDAAATETMLEGIMNDEETAQDITATEKPESSSPRPKLVKRATNLPLPTVAEVHQHWVTQLKRYEQAAQTTIFFGRQRGKTLADVQKRDLRWFAERLVSQEKCTKALAAVRVLLYPNPDNRAEYEQAKRHVHPWKKVQKEQRSVRSHAFDQQSTPPKNKRVLLGELSLVELDKLHDELSDAITFAKEYEHACQTITWFMAGPPPDFPVVVSVPDHQQIAIRERRHTTALERFNRPYGSKGKDIESITADKLHAIETEARNEVLRTETALRASYHPLDLNRVIHWQGNTLDLRGANLLVHQQTGELRVACNIAGRYAPQSYLEQPLDDAWRLLTNHEQLFQPPVPLVTFGIEIGESMYDHLMQLKSTSAVHRDATDASAPILQEIKIVYRQTGWYAQLTLQHIMPIPAYEPNGFLAFHHHANGYSYAFLDRTTQTIETGDVVLPTNIPPPANYRASHNYAYEVVHAMLRVAQQYQSPDGALPYLGIERTMWLKRTPAASRTRNRRIRSYPIQKIVDTFVDKAREHGFYPLIVLWGCHPSHDCGQCGHRDTTERGATRLRDVRACFDCHKPVHKQTDITVSCAKCGKEWQNQEYLFTCNSCTHRELARYNTARYLVQRIPQNVVDDWQWRQQHQKS